MSDTACHIYLVRHGATGHNLVLPPRMQGRHVDESLAPQGRREAERAAAALAAVPIAAVYTSPLKRSLETATTIAARHRFKPVAVEHLVEVDVGRWEDRAWEDIAENDAVAYRAFREDPVTHGYPGGENLAAVAARVVTAIDEIARDHAGQRIVIVAHSVVNRVYLGELLGVPFPLRRRLPQDNCAISQVSIAGGERRVLSINALEHLASHAAHGVTE